MSCKSFFLPEESLFGAGCLSALGDEILKRSLKKALIVTDAQLAAAGAAKTVADILDQRGLAWALFTGVQPNPTLQNVTDGVQAYRENGCDFLIALGGGSANDCT